MIAPRAGVTAEASRTSENAEVARGLEEVAGLLEAQGATPFRVAAYRRAAGVVRDLAEPLADLLARGGQTGLMALPGIGQGLASAISEMVATGTFGLLERLRGAVSPEDLFTSLPGIGPELARRIQDRLGIETFEELELAAWDGRLARVPGFGPRRLETLRAVLDQRLSRSRRRSARLVRRALAGEPPHPKPARPPVDLLLTVDREYRSRAEAGRLARIAPRRFNPRHIAWLPILHMEAPPWSLHALYSNTAQAHHLGRTRDWVVIYYERDGGEGQATVVTEQRGPLAGRRVVRGREEECAERYAAEV